MDLELWQMDRKYARLRTVEPGADARLAASIAEQGQRAPVLVAAGEAELRFVLIDGYRRVAALERLGRDTAAAQVFDGSEADALVWSHALRNGRRVNVLEEAWLLQALEREHGLGRDEIAARLARSESWVSRRLALLDALPESAQSAVRGGRIQAQSAMKYLVPLARANAEQCLRLVERIEPGRLSVRATGELYAAWRAGDAEQRRRIVEQPLLYLRATRADAHVDAHGEDDAGVARDRQILDELARLAGLCRQVRRSMGERRRMDRRLPWPAMLRHGWMEAQASFHALLETVTEESADARS